MINLFAPPSEFGSTRRLKVGTCESFSPLYSVVKLINPRLSLLSMKHVLDLLAGREMLSFRDNLPSQVLFHGNNLCQRRRGSFSPPAATSDSRYVRGFSSLLSADPLNATPHKNNNNNPFRWHNTRVVYSTYTRSPTILSVWRSSHTNSVPF